MDRLRAAYRVSVIIGLAMMASLLIFTIIVGLFEKGVDGLAGRAALSGKKLELVKFIMLGASAAIFFLIKIINARSLADEGEQRERPDARLRPMTGAPPEFGRLTTTAIITYALCETPAVFGLILFFLGRSSPDFHIFLIISLFFFAVYFPKYSQWEEWYRKQQGQGTGTGRIQK